MREVIEKGHRKGFVRTTDHPFVGKTALNVLGNEYRITSFVIGIREFETERSKDIMSYEYESIEQDIKRYECLQRHS